MALPRLPFPGAPFFVSDFGGRQMVAFLLELGAQLEMG